MNLDELDLPYLPMEKAEMASDPLPYVRAAKARHPWLAKCAFGYAVTDFVAMQDLLWMDGPLISSYDVGVAMMDAEGTPWGDWSARHMLSAQQAQHKRLRDVLVPKFTPRQANANRDVMRRVIAELLDEWAPKGAFDFEDFASYFPITVMCTMIGAPPSAIPALRGSLEALGLSASLDKTHVPALQQAYLVMEGFVQDLVAGRRAGQRLRPEPDLLDSLVEAVDSGGINDVELYDLLIFLFVAGYDTSKNMLVLIMDQMIARPDIYERCATDIALCRKVMDETFRFLSVGTIPRVTAEEVTYRDVVLPPGTSLFFPVTISGRDEDAFPEADRFEPELDRKNRHMAFGRGMHICLGQFIARAQIEEGLHLIAQRITAPKRTGPSTWRPFFGTWGMRGLPMSFTPAELVEEEALEPA